jgi:hypothetical protein
MIPVTLMGSFMFTYGTNNDGKFRDLGPGMQYFDCQGGQDGNDKFSCSSLADTSRHDEILKYPTTFMLRDKDGYAAAIQDAGLDLSWISFDDYKLHTSIDVQTPTAAGPGGSGQGSSTFDYYYQFKNFPIMNATMVVPNPKDIVVKALDSIPELRIQMAATQLDFMLGLWSGGSRADGADTYSMPIFMLMQAVDNMEQAKQLGIQEKQEEDAEAAAAKNGIILLISLLLLVVPVVGEEVAVAAGLVTFGRSIAIAGELGNGALAIYDSVQDPKSAFVNIMGMLFGVGSIVKAARSGNGLGDIAKLKRGMSTDSVASFGKIFKDNDAKLTSIRNFCKNK